MIPLGPGYITIATPTAPNGMIGRLSGITRGVKIQKAWLEHTYFGKD